MHIWGDRIPQLLVTTQGNYHVGVLRDVRNENSQPQGAIMRPLAIILVTCALNLILIQSGAYSDDARSSGKTSRDSIGCAVDENSPLRTEDVAFASAFDGSLQHYVVMFPNGYEESRPHDVLIAFHGHGSDRWQFIRDPRPECQATRDVANKYNMIFVAPDYRAKTSWMGPAAEADTVQIIRELKAQYAIGKVFLCGGSMGGTACLIFATLHPDLIAGVASMNGTANLLEYGNFQDAISASYGGSKEEVAEEYRKRSPELFTEKLSMPVGITAGGKDDVVPADSVLRLSNKIKDKGGNVLLLYRRDGGHETQYSDAFRVVEFAILGVDRKSSEGDKDQEDFPNVR